MKTCTKCGQEKPKDEFNKRKVGRDGLASECRDCQRAYQRRYRQENPERARQYRANSTEWRRAYEAKHRKEWYWRDRDRRLKWAREWSKNNRDKLRIAQNAWRKVNPEKHRAQQWVQNHRRRESRKAMQSDDTLRAYVQVLYHDPCSYCDAPASEVDHIVSHSAGGSTEWQNSTAACPTCNRSKGTKPLLAFLAERA